MPSVRSSAVVLLAAFVVACGPEVSADAGSPPAGTEVSPGDSVAAPLDPAVAEATSAAATTAGIIEGMAVLYSDLDAELAPQMDGVVTAVHADLGDAVQAGQLLAQLDDLRQLARAASAKASLDLARAEFARAEGLLESGFVTRAQYDEARYRLGMAEAAMKEAEVELAHTRVTAPFAGIVTRRMTGVGRAVAQGEPMFRVTTLQPLRALVRVVEADARNVRRGEDALLVGDDGTVVDARVARISPAVDPGSGTVEILLDVPRPGPLRPGSAAVARFPRVVRQP